MPWVDITGDIQFEIVNTFDANTLFCVENANNIVEKKEFGSTLLQNFIESDSNINQKKQERKEEKNPSIQQSEIKAVETSYVEQKPIPISFLNDSAQIASTSSSTIPSSIQRIINTNSSIENYKKQELIAELLSIIQKILSL